MHIIPVPVLANGYVIQRVGTPAHLFVLAVRNLAVDGVMELAQLPAILSVPNVQAHVEMLAKAV